MARPPLVLAAVVVGLAALGPAHAQPAPAPAARAMPRVEQHIDELHRRLGITPAQEPQWSAFAGILRQNAQAMRQAYADHPVHSANGSALDDLRNYAALSREHADNVGRLLPPFEALYASLSPDQRAAADRTFQSFRGGPDRPGRP